MIEIENLQKIESGRTILELDEIKIHSGEVCAIIGAAGSGLGSLLDLLLGISLPSSGIVRINELDPTRAINKIKTQTGFLFKENALYLEQTAEKNLLFFTKLYGLPRTRAYEILQEVGLADQAGAKVKDLSSGLSRRLAFGRAILHKPITLIIQEPFDNCDEQAIHAIQKLIQKSAAGGCAILILNHDSAHLKNMSSSLVFMKQGQVENIVESETNTTANLPFKIPVKLQGKVALLNPREIFFAEAQEGQALLVTEEAAYDSQFTLNDLEKRLKRYGFFRAHRSYLVNLQYVKEIIPYSRNSYSLRLTDGENTEIPLSKNSASELRDLLDY